jgi:hypothetical protein
MHEACHPAVGLAVRPPAGHLPTTTATVTSDPYGPAPGCRGGQVRLDTEPQQDSRGVISRPPLLIPGSAARVKGKLVHRRAPDVLCTRARQACYHAQPGASTSAASNTAAHGRVWSAAEPQGFIESCTVVGGVQINIMGLGRITKPGQELLDASPGQSSATVPRVGHDVGQVTTDPGRIRRRGCVPGHLTEAAATSSPSDVSATNAATSQVAR